MPILLLRQTFIGGDSDHYLIEAWLLRDTDATIIAEIIRDINPN